MAFWDLILREQAKFFKKDIFNDALSVFFKNYDESKQKNIPFGDGKA